jgi:translation elongation factor EF-Ts
MEITQQQ